MKQLKVTTLIKECSNCPYANIWGMYCGKYKRKLPEMTESGQYTIPDWCELDNLQDTEELAPELTMCYYNNGSCVGIMCGSADHNTSTITKNPHEIKFKCKEYGVWIVRK